VSAAPAQPWCRNAVPAAGGLVCSVSLPPTQVVCGLHLCRTRRLDYCATWWLSLKACRGARLAQNLIDTVRLEYQRAYPYAQLPAPSVAGAYAPPPSYGAVPPPGEAAVTRTDRQADRHRI
jgi:hypothetical protein